MITQGPFALTIGTPLTLTDPNGTSNNPSGGLQLQNASPFVISVASGGQTYAIQSFTAQTIPTQPAVVTVLPQVSSIAGTTTYPQALTVIWLRSGESSPMVDGPLTAAAIVFGLSAQGLAGQGVGSMTVINTGTLASNAHFVSITTVRIWNVAWYPTGVDPASGVVRIAIPIFASLNGAADVLHFDENGSNRLAGLLVPGFEVDNLTDQSITGLITVGPA